MTDAEDDEVRIDWATATVRDATLSVVVTGDPSEEWAARVAEVAGRLSDGTAHWGAVRVTTEAITVSDVVAGTEADLRHVLEGAAQQASADLAPVAGGANGDGDASPQDAAMTDAFREGT